MRTNRLLGILLIAGAFISGMPGAAQAEEKPMCPVCAKAGDEAAPYGTKAGFTLVRGATNTLFGWTELLRQPAQEVQEGGNVFAGMAKGVGESVKRTLAGAGEVLTFWTPKTKDGRYLHFANDCPVCMGKR